MNELLSLLKDVGVPTGIALIVLLRIEPKLDALTKAVLELPAHIRSAGCAPPSTSDTRDPQP
jgi:hypothetical protein